MPRIQHFCGFLLPRMNGAFAHLRVPVERGATWTPDAPFRQQPPSPGPEPTFTPPRWQRFKLKNGLDVYLVEFHDLPLVDFNLMIKTGGAANPIDRAGLANLTADMLDEGTKTRTALGIADEIAVLGATLSTFHSTMRASSGLLKLATAARASAKRLSSTALKAAASAAASAGLSVLGEESAWDISLGPAGGTTPLPVSRAIGKAGAALGVEEGRLDAGGVRRTPMSGLASRIHACDFSKPENTRFQYGSSVCLLSIAAPIAGTCDDATPAMILATF